MKPFTVLLFVVCIFSFTATAQQKRTTVKQQFWGAYLSSATIAKKWAIWNDFHYVNNGGFFVARTGITYQLPQTAITCGYAFLLLPVGATNTALERKEHRPWAQVVFSTPLAPNYALTNRIRYDARFRQKSADGKLLDGYQFNHRLRFQTTLRKTLPKLHWGKNIPFVTIGNEALFNFGKVVRYNAFDQFRASLMFGVQHGNTQYMTGYVQRYVLSGYNAATDVFDYTQNHTLAVWVIQKLDWRKAKHPHSATNYQHSAN